MVEIMPDKYREMSEDDLRERIRAVREKFGDELVILAHHYQRQEIVDLGDFRGDSFKLSKQAAEHPTAGYIVFCGVHFMAESAAILAREGQAVFIPDPEAGCPMADMAEIEQVQGAWEELGRVVDLSEVTPVTYVNSKAEIKAFCGANGGATCTSSNADKIFSWALTKTRAVLFLPDEHLGRNTAAKLDLSPVALWDPGASRGGLSEEEIREARVLVWKGHCHVHTNFTAAQVGQARAKHPGCKVVVHPECPREVVLAADDSGSTEQIIAYVEKAPKGSTVAVGTEIHLVERLARKYKGEKTVVPLARSLCPNMYKINLHNLCWVLEGLAAGPDGWVNRVTVEPEVKRDAALALRRMLEMA